MTPLSKPNPAYDRVTFGAIEWEAASLDLTINRIECAFNDDEAKVAEFAERLSFCVLRPLCETISIDKVKNNDTRAPAGCY